MKKIAHFGAFDHDSYGDLLFPYLAEFFLGGGFSLVHVAPTNSLTSWADARKIISVETALKCGGWDGVLIGGGDIIQASPWLLGSWAKKEITATAALPSLWMGAGVLASRLSIPLAWNSPGCPDPVSEASADLAKHCMKASEYISVRDNVSAKRLSGFLDRRKIHIIPDSALSICYMWPGHTAEIQGEYFVFEMNAKLLETKFDEIRKSVEHILSLHRVKPVFLSLTPWMGGAGLYKEFAGHFQGSTVIPHPGSIKRAAGLIANSAGYVGNSLHGFITAVSYGKPAALVRPTEAGKYLGFFKTCKFKGPVENNLIASWEQLLIVNKKLQPVRVPADAMSACVRHWEDIRKVLLKKSRIKSKLFKKIRDTRIRSEEALLSWGSGSKYLQRQLFLHQRAVSERDDCIVALQKEAAKLNATAADQCKMICDRNDQIAQNNKIAAEREAHIVRLEERMIALERQSANAALLNEKAGKYSESLRVLGSLLEIINADSVPAGVLIKIGELCGSMGLDKACEYVLGLAAAKYKDPGVLFVLVKVAMEQRRYAAAKELLALLAASSVDLPHTAVVSQQIKVIAEQLSRVDPKNTFNNAIR